MDCIPCAPLAYLEFFNPRAFLLKRQGRLWSFNLKLLQKSNEAEGDTDTRFYFCFWPISYVRADLTGQFYHTVQK
jgi:hypothetical protein